MYLVVSLFFSPLCTVMGVTRLRPLEFTRGPSTKLPMGWLFTLYIGWLFSMCIVTRHREGARLISFTPNPGRFTPPGGQITLTKTRFKSPSRFIFSRKNYRPPASQIQSDPRISSENPTLVTKLTCASATIFFISTRHKIDMRFCDHIFHLHSLQN